MRALLVMVAGCQFSASFTPTSDGGVPIVVGFERGASVEDEASGTVMVPVTLNAASGLPVMVNYQVSDGSATRGLDYDATNGTLQFLAGETTKFVPVTILADANEEGDETINIHLRDVIGADLGTADHAITINSDILPRVFFTLLQSSGEESQASVQLNIALDVASATEVKVDYTLGGTASSADYNLAAGTVVFPAGITSRTIDLAPIDDMLDEDPEDAVVTLQDPVDVIVKPTEGVRRHTLTDNDPEPTISFTQSSTTVNETATVNMTVMLSAVSGRTVSVPFSAVFPNTDPASAADFAYSTTDPLVVPAGTQQLAITATIVDDALDEFVESFSTTLGTPTNAMLVTTSASFTISITDDDQEPDVMFDPLETDLAVTEGSNGNPKTTYKLLLSAPSGKPISVPIQFSGTASRTTLADYSDDAPVVFAPGVVEATLTLDIVPDGLDESDETVIMNIPTNGGLTDVRQGSPSTRTHTIVDDDDLL